MLQRARVFNLWCVRRPLLGTSQAQRPCIRLYFSSSSEVKVILNLFDVPCVWFLRKRSRKEKKICFIIHINSYIFICNCVWVLVSQVSHCLEDDCDDFLPWLERKAGGEITSVLSIGKSAYGRFFVFHISVWFFCLVFLLIVKY